jgi:hypothetical protein
MPEALEYVVNSALMHCDKGVAMLPLTVTSNTTVHMQRQCVGTEMDMLPLTNIPSFGMCSITKSPCVPVPTMWQNTYQYVKVKGFKPLLFQSCMQCGAGGKIEFLTSGQLPLADSVTPESVEQIEVANQQAKEAVEEYEAQKDAVGESGILEGFIPVWGSGRDAVNAFQTGHWGWGIFHSALVVVDVFTLGGGTVVKGLVKGGLKTAGKAALEGLSKKALAALAAKQTAVNLVKQTAEQVAKFSVKRLGVCITKACFVAGTPVATKEGLKNIEDIQFGDEVWAYDEKTGEIGLKEVVNVFEKETNALIELTLEGETITTTPEHPFYANGEWREAGLLETGDSILLFSGRLVKVEKVQHVFVAEPVAETSASIDETVNPGNAVLAHTQKVYNFEVKDWHTYFVGRLQLLVHNATCLRELGKNGAKYLQDILKGIKFKLTTVNLKGGSKVLNGAGSVLDDIYNAQKNIINQWKNSIATASNIRKGNFGEMASDAFLAEKNFQPLHTRLQSIDAPTHQGIDGVFKKGNEYFIVEAKYHGTATLGNTIDGKQMSDAWINGSDRLLNAVGPTVLQDINAVGYRRLLAEVSPDGSIIYKELDANANVIGTFTP